jgi:hypothetical protein
LITVAVDGPAGPAAAPAAEDGNAPASARPSPGIVGTVPEERSPRRRVRLTPPKED